MTRPFLALALTVALAAFAAQAQASTILVTTDTGLTADGTIDWGTLGSSFTVVPGPFTIATGIVGTSADVSMSSGESFQRRDQDDGWAGNFGTGEELLWTNDHDGAIDIVFSSAITGFGSQIQTDMYQFFTATIFAYDALNNLLGTVSRNDGVSTPDGDDSAIFLGILSSAQDIVRLRIETNGGDFAINNAIVQGTSTTPTPVPEPATLLLLGGGLVAVARRVRSARRS